MRICIDGKGENIKQGFALGLGHNDANLANMLHGIKLSLLYTEIFSVWKASVCEPEWIAAST